MKTLIFISQIYQLGGAEQLGYDLALSLNELGYEVGVAVMYKEEVHNYKDNIDKLIKCGIEIHFLGLDINPPKHHLIYSAWKLRKIISKERYGILELSTVSPTIIGLTATFFLDVRVIVGVHQVYKLERENSLNYKIYRLLVSFRKNIHLYFISEFVRQSSIKYFNGINPGSSIVLYNSIRDVFFESDGCNYEYKKNFLESLGVHSDKKIILYCGRIAKYKGIDVVIKSSVEFLKNDCILIYLGAIDTNISGTMQSVSNIQEIIKNNEINDSVFFLEHRNDVKEIMSISDVLVHPTEIEGFGLVLAEACALNLPIVTSDVEAIPEILDGTNAVMLNNGTINEYSEAIRKKLYDEIREDYKEVNKKVAMKYKSKSRVSRFVERFLS